jgi:adenylylsulfate kinase
MRNDNPFTLWLLGPTSSGKTTIADGLLNSLKNKGIPVIHYDGDEIREIFGDSLGFSAQDRLRVVSTIVKLANKASASGMNVIVSALTANSDARKYIKDNINNLIVGYVSCPIEECAKRDPKGLYKKAERGEIDTLIGYNQEYIAPDSPDIILDTELKSKLEIIEYIELYLRIS